MSDGCIHVSEPVGGLGPDESGINRPTVSTESGTAGTERVSGVQGTCGLRVAAWTRPAMGYYDISNRYRAVSGIGRGAPASGRDGRV